METAEYPRILEGVRKKVVVGDEIDEIRFIAGVDQAFPDNRKVISCMLVLGYPGRGPVEKVFSMRETDFPYIPGHKISLESSLRITRDSVRGHKLPEPLRLAHKFVNPHKKWMKESG